MGNRTTISEARWAHTPEFVATAAEWQRQAEEVILGLVWIGYDRLKQDVLSEVDLSEVEVLERDLTQLLALKIDEQIANTIPFCPFTVLHEFDELEGRSRPPARPKQNDFAFVLYANPRIALPFEAKVLQTDARLAEYTKEVKDNFLSCRYAPFSSQAGMLGYLLSGSPQAALLGIGRALACTLTQHASFPQRDHATSEHDREVPQGSPYPARIRLHHLIMPLA